MIKIMHIITTLGPAGAETMLCRMVSGMDGARFENEIVSLTGILDLAESMQGIGVRVRTLGMKASVPNPFLVVRLANGSASRDRMSFTPGCTTQTWSAPLLLT